ncbi:hypothetical protein WJX82_005217 [Trebouxia sp. C0006]
MSFEKVLPERQHHPVINGTTESHYTEGTKVSVATSGKLLLKVVDGTFLLAIAWIGLREMYVSAGQTSPQARCVIPGNQFTSKHAPTPIAPESHE